MSGAAPPTTDLPIPQDHLVDLLAEAVGAPVQDWTAQRSPYTTSFPIHDVAVLTDRGEHHLVLKDLRWSSLSPTARTVKELHHAEPAREVGTYRTVLAGTAGPPRCHGGRAVVGARSGWLLLEHVRGRELYQWGDLDAWRSAARWLAGFHRRWTDDGDRGRVAGVVPLLVHDRAALAAMGPRRGRDGQGDPVLSAWDRAADHLASLPRTLVHGEPYASNVLVDDDGRVAVVDWETTAIGTGWTDLAALAMGWPDAARSELLQAYLGVLGHDLLPADPVATLEAARLQLCLQWLGTDESWRAPVEHHRDWHADAVAIITGPSWPW